jgi:hypothetical protein
MKLKSTDTLEFIRCGLTVNGKSFVVEYPDEPILGIEDGNLVTIVFRRCGCSLTHWAPKDIEGHFPEQVNEGW